MPARLFSKFVRPASPRSYPITERDLDLLAAVLRYRFSPASELVRLVGGNEDVTLRRLRRLWEQRLVNRWAFPGIRAHSEFCYYLDSRESLNVLADRRGLQIQPPMIEEIRRNRERNYAEAALRGQHMQLGFLRHGLMISRFHFLLEMACQKSHGSVELINWQQGSQLAGHKVAVARVKTSRDGGDQFWQETDEVEKLPVEPDALFSLRFPGRPQGGNVAHFFYEADRGSMVSTDMLKKFRAYYHFIKRQQGHREAFSIHPIRAVLIETTDEARGRRLMDIATHPLVCGNARRTGLFWFSISELLTTVAAGVSVPHYLTRPEVVFEPIWALPDRSLHRLTDSENSAEGVSAAA